jgi:hypothetical protein
MYLFFRYNGANPLNLSYNEVVRKIEHTVDFNLEFKGATGNWESYRADQILQYNEQSLREMADKLKGIKPDKDFLELINRSTIKFQNEFGNNTYVDMCNILL